MVIRCFNMGCPTWKYSFWAIDKSYDRFWRLVPNMHWCSDGSYWILWIYCSPIIGAYVPEHIWLPYQNKSLILHLEPRDTWCLRWGLTPGIGRFVYIRKAFTALYFLALRNDQFQRCSRDWSNSGRPLGTFMYFQLISIRSGVELLHIHTSRGRLPLLVLLHRALVGL